MNREVLKHLSKDELIQIIMAIDETSHREAKNKVIQIVDKRLMDIMEKQKRCDFATHSGRAEYFKLDAKFAKWEKIFQELVKV